MWDQLVITRSKYLLKRIIPTYVGSTSSIIKLSIEATNHSHVCGINYFTISRRVAELESFPRMWDQLLPPVARPFSLRIIPTYVGSTGRGSSPCPRTSNHSHVCGINPKNRIYNRSCFESFPRMWDQRIGRRARVARRRIIPTYVGSTP